jgi:uncharacterized membrane protein YobD (UPF0266 family)
VLMVEFMLYRTTGMSEVYCKMLKKPHRAVQDKRHGVLTSGLFVVLLYGNVCLHSAACTRTLQEHFNWQLFDHP